MKKVQFRYKNSIIETRCVTTIPSLGERVAFYSYEKSNLANMNLVEYIVTTVTHILKDPAPKENFVSEFIGEEITIINLLTIEEHNQIIEKLKADKPMEK